MSTYAGPWQRSEQAPVFDVMSMKDNEDEHGWPFFNLFSAKALLLSRQGTSSQYQYCYLDLVIWYTISQLNRFNTYSEAAMLSTTEALLRTMLIPLNSKPPTSETATCWLQTMKPRDLFHADCQFGAWDFSAVRILPLDSKAWSRKTGSLWKLPTAYPPCTERPDSHV